MRMDRLTSKFQMALSEAQSLAVGRDHQFIEPVHLFWHYWTRMEVRFVIFLP